MSSFNIKAPTAEWLKQFLYPSLQAAPGYSLDIVPDVNMKLDQNESPWDFPAALKDKILERLRHMPWNRYPNPMGDEVNQALAKYVGVKSENIITAPGSNHLIVLMYDALAHQLPGKVVVTRPSFPLFEMHCRYSNVAYEPWNLNADLEYDVANLPSLPKGSLVVFASPNNPTGTYLPKATLKSLLTQHPDTMFVADEAYVEFAGESYLDLMADHSNMLIIRTLSKTMGAAGIRLGYMIGSAPLMHEIRKLRLPYMLNHFTVAAVLTILEDPELSSYIARNVSNARQEREKLFEALQPIAKTKGFAVKHSQANFLLAKWSDPAAMRQAYEHLLKKGILVRDVSKAPGMAGCLRMTVGSTQENTQLIAAFQTLRS